MQTARVVLVSVAVVIFGACTTPAPAVTVVSPLPVDGKTMAPVELQAELKAAEANVTVRLEDDASELEVSAWGLDGLVAKSTFTPNISKRGQSQTFTVPMTPGPGQSTLAISVSGTFRGNRLQRVATFAIGQAGPKKPSTDVIVTDQGEVIKDRRAPAVTPPGQTPNPKE